jgi:hypothetical protein
MRLRCLGGHGSAEPRPAGGEDPEGCAAGWLAAAGRGRGRPARGRSWCRGFWRWRRRRGHAPQAAARSAGMAGRCHPPPCAGGAALVPTSVFIAAVKRLPAEVGLVLPPGTRRAVGADAAGWHTANDRQVPPATRAFACRPARRSGTPSRRAGRICEAATGRAAVLATRATLRPAAPPATASSPQPDRFAVHQPRLGTTGCFMRRSVGGSRPGGRGARAEAVCRRESARFTGDRWRESPAGSAS